MRTIGRYELVSRLATGHLGDLYLARIPRDSGGSSDSADQAFAVKVYRRQLLGSARFVDLLMAERPAAVAFRHPGSIEIVEVGDPSIGLFVAMELGHGQPLSAVLQRAAVERWPLSRPLLLWIALMAARTLHAAHRTPWEEGADSGILHAGLSPNSILLTYHGEVKVVGLGVGRSHLVLPPSHLRLAYRAPELVKRTGTDRRADIYSLGVILYDALTGQRSFKRRTTEETQAAVLEHRLKPLSYECGGVSQELEALVAGMTTKARGDRPSSMSRVEPVLARELGADEASLSSELREQMNGLFPAEAKSHWNVVDAVLRRRSDTIAMPNRLSSEPTPSMIPHSSPVRPLRPGAGIRPIPLRPTVPPEASAPPSLMAVEPLPDSAFLELPPSVRPADLVSPPPESALESGQLELSPAFDFIDDARFANRNPSAVDPGAYAIDPIDPSDTIDPGSGPPESQADALIFAEALESYPPSDSLIDDEISQDIAPLLKSSVLDFRPGAVIGGKYRVLGLLGEGGMGVVYRVEHTLMRKELALKLLRPDVSTIPQITKRFEREARAVCQLDHPNIVRVFDFGREPNGMLFLVMELIVGESLLDRLAHGASVTIGEALEIIEQVLSALDHAHRHEIVHRDLKPDNVMLTQREGALLVKILDFGIAKVASVPAEPELPPLTQRGMVFGTPQYMSPEQARGETVDGRADLYTVGLLLYQILTRRLPFDGEDMSSILMQQITQPAPPLNLDLDDRLMSARLELLMLKALAKDKQHRFGTPAEFRAAVREIREGRLPEAYPPRDPAAVLTSDLRLPGAERRSGSEPSPVPKKP